MEPPFNPLKNASQMEKVKLTVKDHSRLTEHRMGYYSGFEDEESEPHFIFPARIMITFFGREGSVVIYRVRMGYFDLEILLCNIQGNAYDKQTNVGKGSFGHVRTQRSQGRTFIVKRQPFQKTKPEFEGWELANREEIQAVIIQVAIAKICSVYQIGPQFDLQIGFDLLCYSNCTEFQMELCEPASYQQILKSREALEESLRVMHSLHIVHKDIKPNNIVYSRTLGKCVFIDFGLSQIIRESRSQKTLTYYEGTPCFMSPQLLRLKGSKEPGYVDLYYNDRYALRKLFQVCEANLVNSSQNQGARYFRFSSKVPANEEDIAALAALQSQFQQRLNVLQLESNQVSQVLELNNYEFLKLMVKYSSFDVFKRKSTRNCWRYLNYQQFKQMLEIIVNRRERLTISDAISELLFQINASDSRQIEDLWQFQRNIDRIRGPEFQFSWKQSDVSLKHQLRVYGFSAFFLQSCKNTQTSILKEEIIKWISQKQLLEQAKLVIALKDQYFHQNLMSSSLKDYQIKRLKKQSFTNLIQCAKWLINVLTKTNQNDILAAIKRILSEFDDNPQLLSAIEALFHLKCQSLNSEFDQNSSSFKQLIKKLHILTKIDKINLTHLSGLFKLVAQELNFFNPQAVIKYLLPLKKQISLNSDSELLSPFISQIDLAQLYLGQYRNYISPIYENFIPSRYYKSAENRWFQYFSLQIKVHLIKGLYMDALSYCRLMLSLYNGRISTIYCLSKAHITVCFLHFAQIYKLLGLRKCSLTLFFKHLSQNQQKAPLPKRFVILDTKAEFFLHFNNPMLFEVCYTELKALAIRQFADQCTFNLWVSWAKQLLYRDNSIQKSIRCFLMCQLYAHPRFSILNFVEYVKILIIRKEFQNARKIVLWMISLKKQRPLSEDYIVLEGYLFKILMTMREYKRAFKASKKMIEKVKEIQNCGNSLAQFFAKCAELCYFHSLPKKAIEYCEMSFKLVQSPLTLLQTQFILSKVEVLKGNYKIAKRIMSQCISKSQIQQVQSSIIAKQAQFYIFLIGLYTNREIIQQHEFLFKQISTKFDLYRYHFRQSQISFAKGTKKQLKNSLREALITKSFIHIEKLIEPVNIQLIIGKAYLSLKKRRQALFYFQSAAKLSIKIKNFYSAYTAYAFSKIGQTLFEMGEKLCGGVYCRIACGIFNKLKLKLEHYSVYRKALIVIRLNPTLPFVPFEVPLKRYFANIITFLKTRTIEQHRQLYSIKSDLLEIFNCGKCDLQQAKCRLEMAIHLKMIEQNQSMKDLWQKTRCLLSASSDSKIIKNMDLFRQMLKTID